MAISGVGAGGGTSYLSEQDVIDVFGGGQPISGAGAATTASGTTVADTFGVGATDTGDGAFSDGTPAHALPYETAVFDTGVSSPGDMAAALATQLLDPLFIPVDAELAIAAAQNLQGLADIYEPENADALDGQIEQWSQVARELLAQGTRLDTTVATFEHEGVVSARETAGSAGQTGGAAQASETTAHAYGAFFGVGDAGQVGTQTIAGIATTPEEYLPGQALVFVEKTFVETRSIDMGESTSSYTEEVRRTVLVAADAVAGELGLSQADAAAYSAAHAAYLLPDGSVGTSEQFISATGREPLADDRAYLVRAEATFFGESHDEHQPAVYGTAAQHLAAVGMDSGVYSFLPAGIVAQAQASTHGHVLLTSSDQITTVQAHLDDQAIVFVRKMVDETRTSESGESWSTYTERVERDVPMPMQQAVAELGLSDGDAAAFLAAHSAYLLQDGSLGDAAAFERDQGRPPTAADRAYIVQTPTYWISESGDTSTPARYGSESTYLEAIGLSADVPRDLNIAFNNSYSRRGDVYLDASHGSVDMTVVNGFAHRAYAAVADDALAGKWVQIGDKGPLNDDITKILDGYYEQFHADTPEKQDAIKNALFKYDERYGILANRELIEQAQELNNNRRQGFFESGFGRIVLTAVASYVAGPAGAAMVSGAYTAANGGTLLDVVVSAAASYFGGQVGQFAGEAVSGLIADVATEAAIETALAAGSDALGQAAWDAVATAGLDATTSALGQAAITATSNMASNAFQQLVLTGDLDIEQLLQAGAGGLISGGTAQLLLENGFGASIDQHFGFAPGTTANLTAAQLSSLLTTGELDASSFLNGVAGGLRRGGTATVVESGAEGATLTGDGVLLNSDDGDAANWYAFGEPDTINVVDTTNPDGVAVVATDGASGVVPEDGIVGLDGAQGDIGGAGRTLPELSPAQLEDLALVAELRAAGYTDEGGVQTWRNPTTGAVVYEINSNTGLTTATTGSRTVVTDSQGHVVSVDGGSYGSAFAQARASGAEIFTWNGKPYTTEWASEEVARRGGSAAEYDAWAQQQRSAAAATGARLDLSANAFFQAQATNAAWEALASSGIDTGYYRALGMTPDAVAAAHAANGNDHRLAVLAAETQVLVSSVVPAASSGALSIDLGPEFGGAMVVADAGQANAPGVIGTVLDNLARVPQGLSALHSTLVTAGANLLESMQVGSNVMSPGEAAGAAVSWVLGAVAQAGQRLDANTDNAFEMALVATGGLLHLAWDATGGAVQRAATVFSNPNATDVEIGASFLELVGVAATAVGIAPGASRLVGGASVSSTGLADAGSLGARVVVEAAGGIVPDSAATHSVGALGDLTPSVGHGAPGVLADVTPSGAHTPSAGLGGDLVPGAGQSTPRADFDALVRDVNTANDFEFTLDNLGIAQADFLARIDLGSTPSQVLKDELIARGVAPDVVAMLGHADDAKLANVLAEMGLLDELVSLSGEADVVLRSAKLETIAQHVDGAFVQTLGQRLAALDTIFEYPEASIVGANLNRGSGGLNDVFVASVDGQPAVVKVPKGTAAALDLTDYNAAVNLQAFGGPEVLGVVRVEVDGVWKVGFAMERVEGIDLLSAQRAVASGQPLPFAVTPAHVDALNHFFAQVDAQGLRLGDVQPGDFMLTPDGRIVPLDMTLSTGTTTVGDRQRIFAMMTEVVGGSAAPAPSTGGAQVAAGAMHNATLLGEGAFAAVYDLGDGTVLKQFLPERFTSGANLQTIASDQVAAHVALRERFPEVVAAQLGPDAGTLVTTRAQGMHFDELPVELQGEAWALAEQRRAAYQAHLDEVAPGRWTADGNADNFTYEVVDGRLTIRAAFDPVGAAGQGGVVPSREPSPELPPLDFP